MDRSSPVTAAAYEAISTADVGRRIRIRRRAQGLPQSELARAARITTSMVSRFESGKRRPALGALGRIAELLGTTLEELVGLQEVRDPVTDLRLALTYLRSLPADAPVRAQMESDLWAAVAAIAKERLTETGPDSPAGNSM